jgi:hypothetical protein
MPWDGMPFPGTIKLLREDVINIFKEDVQEQVGKGDLQTRTPRVLAVYRDPRPKERHQCCKC